MESITRNVKDIEADDRRSLENVVGQQLRDNQQIMFRIVEIDMKSGDDQARQKALARAAEIARRGRENVAASGATEQEIKADIEEAIREVRNQETRPTQS